VRPERLRLGLRAVPEGGCGVVVEEIIYHGDHLRARLRAATGQELTAKLLSGMAPEWLRPGAGLHVSWSGEDARALDPLPGHDKPRSEMGRD
jgi:putative spermidine/putrescine transport system ATP-binding protein